MSLAHIALPIFYVQITGARITNSTFILYTFTDIFTARAKNWKIFVHQLHDSVQMSLC
jgi:hypothetical protein